MPVFFTHFTFFFEREIMKTRSDLYEKKGCEDVFQGLDVGNFGKCEGLSSASTSCSMKRQKWRRSRKNSDQVKVLIEEFNKNPHWSKEKVLSLSEFTGLSEVQVYKWSWDYRKKIRKQAGKYNIRELLCIEMVMPSKLDLELSEIMNRYKDSFSVLQKLH